MPRVSVVTPFYNTARHLAACIESVLAQTFSDFEYLLVNNCSSDGSAEIARSYEKRDRRIRCVDQPQFLGQVDNFNAALRLISPESRFCKMVLADDLIMPTCLEEMVRVAEKWPTVGIVSSYYIDGREIKGGGLPYPEERFDGRFVARLQFLEGRFFLGSPTCVLYRSEIVRQRVPFFPVGRYHEDTDLGYELLRTWDLGFVHQVLSFMRAEEDSISGRTLAFQPRLLDAYIALKTHGRAFLTASEYRTVERRLTRRYLGFLGLASLYRRDPEFWAYHEGGLATVGERFRGWRRARYRLLGIWYIVSHPGEAIWALARRLRALHERI